VRCCTWKGCEAAGAEAQIGKDGQEWAFLCGEHHDELEAVMDLVATEDPKKMAPKLIRAWARAGHGHRARDEMKEEIVHGAVALGRFFQAAQRGKK
jgi:hypothetical protein